MIEQTPDRAKHVANVEKGIKVIEQISADLGLRGATFADLSLSEAQLKQMSYIKNPSENGVRFYLATREDGLLVKAIIRATGQGDYAAEIFSPAFYGGHGNNHDFNESELRGSLQTACTAPLYQSL